MAVLDSAAAELAAADAAAAAAAVSASAALLPLRELRLLRDGWRAWLLSAAEGGAGEAARDGRLEEPSFVRLAVVTSRLLLWMTEPRFEDEECFRRIALFVRDVAAEPPAALAGIWEGSSSVLLAPGCGECSSACCSALLASASGSLSSSAADVSEDDTTRGEAVPLRAARLPATPAAAAGEAGVMETDKVADALNRWPLCSLSCVRGEAALGVRCLPLAASDVFSDRGATGSSFPK